MSVESVWSASVESKLRELMKHCMFMTLDEATDYLTQHIKKEFGTLPTSIMFERHGDYREVNLKVTIADKDMKQHIYEVTVRQI